MSTKKLKIPTKLKPKLLKRMRVTKIKLMNPNYKLFKMQKKFLVRLFLKRTLLLILMTKTNLYKVIATTLNATSTKYF